MSIYLSPQRGNFPGECWAFKGQEGYVVIKVHLAYSQVPWLFVHHTNLNMRFLVKWIAAPLFLVHNSLTFGNDLTHRVSSRLTPT